MKKDDKIITFPSTRRKKETEFKLNAELSIYLCRKNEKYICDWHTDDESMTKEQLYSIQKNILENLSEEVEEIKLKCVDTYEVNFTLLYYTNRSGNFTYICLPQNISKEKLAEYLYVSTCIYELKESGAI